MREALRLIGASGAILTRVPNVKRIADDSLQCSFCRKLRGKLGS
jgi:hypothetical protein